MTKKFKILTEKCTKNTLKNVEKHLTKVLFWDIIFWYEKYTHIPICEELPYIAGVFHKNAECGGN